MLIQEQMKKIVGEYAIKYIKKDLILGVGSGSTIEYFINALRDSEKKPNIISAVSSSKKTTELLNNIGIKVVDLNSVGFIDLYIDGADEINYILEMIKGGGAALTQEKILACCSRKFICIADETKLVKKLGKNVPLPIEIIPSARSYVAREIVKLNGMPNWRQDVTTDNGNWILDVFNIDISKPIELEEKLNNIVGVVAHGLFAKNSASELVLARKDLSIEIIK